MEPFQKKRYYSKIDTWLLIVLIGVFIATLLDAFFLRDLPSGKWIILLIVLIWGTVLSLMFPLYYELDSTSLLIRSGWLHRRIPLLSIQRVFPTRNPLSSPALSLDRLRIDYLHEGKSRFALISPKEKAGFLQELAIQGDLQLQGDRLIRL